MKLLKFIIIVLFFTACEKEDVKPSTGDYIHFSAINDNGNIGYLICFKNNTNYVINDYTYALDKEDYNKFNNCFDQMQLSNLQSTYDYPPRGPYDIIYKLIVCKNDVTKEIILNPDYFNISDIEIDTNLKEMFDILTSLIYRK